jgi:hypothetical protein
VPRLVLSEMQPKLNQRGKNGKTHQRAIVKLGGWEQLGLLP